MSAATLTAAFEDLQATGFDPSTPRAVHPEPSTAAAAHATAAVERASHQQWAADRTRAADAFLLEVRSDLASLRARLRLEADEPTAVDQGWVPQPVEAPNPVVHVYESLVSAKPRPRSDRKIDRHIRRWRDRGYELAGFDDNRAGTSGILRATLTFRRVPDQPAPA